MKVVSHLNSVEDDEAIAVSNYRKNRMAKQFQDELSDFEERNSQKETIAVFESKEVHQSARDDRPVRQSKQVSLMKLK